MAVLVALNYAQVLPTPVDVTERQIVLYGTLTLSGSYGGGATNGDTISFSGLDELKSNQLPTSVFIYEEPTAGNAATGYSFLFARGTTQSNGVLIVLQGGGAAAPSVQITQGAAYPGALTAGTTVIKFEATFPYAI
jgi:hypothetical protein